MPSHSKNEGFYQSQFMGDCKKGGCHVVRVASFMKAGILDLNIKHPSLPDLWLELKAVDWPIKANTEIKTETTELQNVFLESRKKVGGRAAALVFFEHPELGRGCFVNHNPHIVRAIRQDALLAVAHWRRKGEGWPIETILQDACRFHGQETYKEKRV